QPTSTTFTQRAVRDSTRDYLVVGGGQGTTGPDFWGLRLSDLLWVAYGPIDKKKPVAALGSMVFDERRTRVIAFAANGTTDAVDFRILDPVVYWRPVRIPGSFPLTFATDFGPEVDGRGGTFHASNASMRLVPYAGGWGFEKALDTDINANTTAVSRDARAG